MTKECKQYSPEFKLEMIKLIEEKGQKVTDIVAQYGVGESTLKTWLKRYRRELQGKPLPPGKALTKKRKRPTQI
jgi:transposase